MHPKIQSGGGATLQAYVQAPDNDRHPDVALVICHQCTALGGCALAVEDIASACSRNGLLTVTFDMRGAGRSTGSCSQWPVLFISGCAEVTDVHAVCEWVHDELGRDVWLVGVSAGGPVAGAAVGSPYVRGYVGIAHVLGLCTSLLFLLNVLRLYLSSKPKAGRAPPNNPSRSSSVDMRSLAAALRERHARHVHLRVRVSDAHGSHAQARRMRSRHS